MGQENLSIDCARLFAFLRAHDLLMPWVNKPTRIV